MKGSLWPLVVAVVAAAGTSAPSSQLPPSIKPSSPASVAPPTEEERKAQCAELKAILAALKADRAWSPQPYADAELRQLQRALNSSGCPDEGGLAGSWRIEGAPDPRGMANRKPLNGTMTIAVIPSEQGIRLSKEKWGEFDAVNLACPVYGDAAAWTWYLGKIQWDVGSYFHSEYCCWWKVDNSVPGSPPTEGDVLLCGSERETRGRLRDGNRTRGGGIDFRMVGATAEGAVHPDFQRTITFTAKKGGR